MSSIFNLGCKVIFTNQSSDISREQLELKLGEQLNALISASHALNVRTAAAFDSELQPAAFLIVRWLLSYGPTSVTCLAESTAMDRSSVSRLVNQLKQRGYVRSEAHPHDRRGVLLSLTELGRDAAVNALKQKETEFYKRISECTDSQLIGFIEMLSFLCGQPLS